MSMNLVFDVKNGPGMVDFPFQTPTELTYAVFNEKDGDKRLELIENYLKPRVDNETLNNFMEEIKGLMSNSNLELSYI